MRRRVHHPRYVDRLSAAGARLWHLEWSDAVNGAEYHSLLFQARVASRVPARSLPPELSASVQRHTHTPSLHQGRVCPRSPSPELLRARSRTRRLHQSGGS